MDKAAAWVGGYPIGPKCWEKMGDKPANVPSIYLQRRATDDDQPDLFSVDPGEDTG